MTTVRSQNGWVARADTKLLTRCTAHLQGGTLLHFWAANEDVGVVLADFAEQFDRRIEQVVGPVLDDWSWANRLIRGSTEVVSNHGSATAVDLNALKHPRKAHNTYSPEKRAELRRLVDEYDGVLRHGEFYRETVDGMHVEIDAGPQEVKHLADKIRKRKAPKPTPPKQEENPMALELSPADIEKIAQRTADLVWTKSQAAPLGQTPGGALHEVDLRTAAANLADRARDGVAPLLTPVTEALGRIETKVDALAPPATPA